MKALRMPLSVLNFFVVDWVFGEVVNVFPRRLNRFDRARLLVPWQSAEFGMAEIVQCLRRRCRRAALVRMSLNRREENPRRSFIEDADGV